VTVFWLGSVVAHGASGFVAAAVLQIKTGLQGWQWLFLIEGKQISYLLSFTIYLDDSKAA